MIKSSPPNKWYIYWQQLTEPSPLIKDETLYQQARLLAGLTFALLVVGIVILIIWVAANPQFTAAPYISVVFIAVLSVSYVLGRSRYVRVGSHLFITLMFFTIVVAALTAPGPIPGRIVTLYQLTMVILLASLLLPLQGTLLVSGASLLVIAIYFTIPSVPFATTYSIFVFTLINACLFIVATYLRNSYQRQLQESQRRYQALFSQSNDAVFILDLAGNHLEVNENAVQMFGYTRDELVRLSFKDMVDPTELPESENRLEKLLANQYLPIYERTFRRKGGREISTEVNVGLVCDSYGNPSHIQSVVRDITERKQAETALQASEARFRRLAQNAPDTIYIFNFNNNSVEYINEHDFLGYGLEELQEPGSITHQVHPDDQPLVVAFWQGLQVNPDDEVQALDYRIKHKLGYWEWIHNRTIILSRTAEGAPAEILVVLTLISDRKRVEERLRQQEAFLRILLGRTPIGIVAVDREGVVTEANPRSLEILGLPNSSTILGSALLALPSLAEIGMDGTLATARATGEMVELETWYSSIWRKEVYLLFRVVPLEEGRSDQVGLIILVEDLTQRRQAEEGMRQMQKMQSLGVLAGGIAHDFNNLLVAMLGQTSLALFKLPPEAAVRPHIEKAVIATEQAARLTQQLLAYSGRGQFQVNKLDLNTLIAENLHLFTATIPKHVHLRAKLADSLPAVEVDVAQIQQVVMNLIINAAEALGSENGTITIVTDQQQITEDDQKYWQYTTEPLTDGLYVTLEVHDDGPGIPAGDLGQIFDPFFTTKEKGHGLGLSAVLGIIKGHSAGLVVYSESGQGTTFKILLPASDKTAIETGEAFDRKSPTFVGQVLVIDDEPYVREAVVEILDAVGIVALTAENGEQGVALYEAQQSKIGLVLLDLSMPGWSGEQTMRVLRKLNQDVRVILSSGYNEIEATRGFVGKGAVGFLQKPYSTNKLLEMVWEFGAET